MDKTRTRLSLSRKRKKGITDGQNTSTEFTTEIRDLSSDGISVQTSLGSCSDENNSSGKIPESTKVVTPGTRHNNTKNGIAAWLKKPYNPKTVPCPVCSRIVFLSKINEHLDSNCESDVDSKADDHLKQNKRKSGCKENGLHGSSFQKCEKDNGLAAVTDDGTKKSRFPQTKHDQMISNSDHVIPEAGFPSLGKKLRSTERNKPSIATVNDDYNGSFTCNDISEGDSPSQDSSTKSVAKVAKESEECARDGGCLQPNQEMSTSNDLSELPTNCIEPIEECSKNSEAENSGTQGQEQKDYEPYYLANFKLVLSSVFSNEDDRQLFNEQDNGIIDTFNGMSPEKQKLYIRLFQRKRGWFRCSKLEYPKICKNLTPVIDSLIQKGKFIVMKFLAP